MERLDAVVIGSGPAGLEAAINLAIRGKRFIVFGHEELSRKLDAAPEIKNYLGFPVISGHELRERFREHINTFGIELIPDQIQTVYPMRGYFALASGKNTYEATAVILATGAFQSKLLEGEEEFLGRGLSYCATCDAPLYKNKTVAVLGYHDEAVYEANFLAEVAAKVHYVPMSKTVLMPREPVAVLAGRAVGVSGSRKVDNLVLEDRSVPVDGVFVLRDAVAPASLVTGLAIENGFVRVNAAMETNLPGCYAAGDCTGKPHQFMRAAGQGQTAALGAVGYIDSLCQRGDEK